jgi:hypothetical protein
LDRSGQAAVGNCQRRFSCASRSAMMSARR